MGVPDSNRTPAADRIRSTKFKLAAYAEYLAGEKERLDRAVADAEQELRAKIERDPTMPTIVKTDLGVGYRAAEPSGSQGSALQGH